MKFTFLVAVILVFCCVYVYGELEIYPGEQQEDNYNNAEVDLFSQLYLDPQWRASIAWQNVRDRDEKPFSKHTQYVNAKVSAHVRQLEEFLKRRRQQLREEAEKSAYYKMRLPDSQTDEFEYRKFPNSKHFDHYQLKYPNQQILDDVRPYPHEDNDFSFRDDGEEVEEEDDISYAKGVDNDKTTPEASGKGALTELKNDEQAEFGYAPPDPRFYEETSSDKSLNILRKEAVPIIYEEESNDDGDQFVVDHRNGGKFESGVGNDDADDNTVEVIAVRPHHQDINESAGVYIIAIVAGISAAATVGLIAFAIGWYNLQKHVKNASDVEYPAYGVTGPNKEVSPSGDRRLAQSAQMYHYQHQKQQIIAMENRASGNERHGSISEVDSDEENEEGDYTVYECPGLAPTGEMEVKNPLFQDDPTPALTPPVKQNDGSVQKK